MHVATTTAEMLQITLDNPQKPQLRYYHAPWCAPCKQLKPILEELEKEHPDTVFISVNIDKAPALAAVLKISSIPLVAITDRNGLEVLSVMGVGPRVKHELETALKRAAQLVT